MLVGLCSTFVPGAVTGQKRASEPLELVLQRVRKPVWVLGAKPGSSGSTAHALTAEPSPAPLGGIFRIVLVY